MANLRNTSETVISIIGGGITGLTTAYYLSKVLPRSRIQIFERGTKLGGYISTEKIDTPNGSVYFELGPRTLRPSRNMLTIQLIHDLGLSDRILFTDSHRPAALNRFIYYSNRLVKLPNQHSTVWDLVNRVFNDPIFHGSYKALFEYFQPRCPHTDESIGAFSTRRFGESLTENILSSLIHGIYAGDIHSLSVRSIFPLLWFYEHQYGSVTRGLREAKRVPHNEIILHRDAASLLRPSVDLPVELVKRLKQTNTYTLKHGLAGCIRRLEKVLNQNERVSIHLNANVESAQYDDKINKVRLGISSQDDVECNFVIASIFSPILADICRNEFQETRLPALSEVQAVNVMLVNLFYDGSQDILPVEAGFGYLIPQSVPFTCNPEFALGVVFDSYAAEGQDTLPGTKLTVMLGGHWWNSWTVLPDSEMGIKMALNVVRRHLNISKHPTFSKATLIRQCIPQYTVGHDNRMKQAHEELFNSFKGTLKVVGTSYTGVGVNDCIQAAWNISQNPLTDEWISKTGLEEFARDNKFVRLSQQRTSQSA